MTKVAILYRINNQSELNMLPIDQVETIVMNYMNSESVAKNFKIKRLKLIEHILIKEYVNLEVSLKEKLDDTYTKELFENSQQLNALEINNCKGIEQLSSEYVYYTVSDSAYRRNEIGQLLNNNYEKVNDEFKYIFIVLSVNKVQFTVKVMKCHKSINGNGVSAIYDHLKHDMDEESYAWDVLSIKK